MTTAGARLRHLAGTNGAAHALLSMIGTGTTTGAALVDWSRLATASAAVHLMTDRDLHQPPGGYGMGGTWRRLRPRKQRDEEWIWMTPI